MCGSPAGTRRRGSGLTPALFVTALLSWAGAPAHAQALNDRAASGLESGVDPGIRPGDDFFAYANGSWLRTAEIPQGRERWGARNEIDQLTHQQLTQLLDEAGAEPAGSIARKVADFRSAYLNEPAIEARGTVPLRPLLDSINRIAGKTGLTRMLGRGVLADVDPLNWGVYRSSHLLGLSVEPGIHGEKSYVAFLVQGGLGLPDREHYLSTDPAMQDLRTRYEDYIGRLLKSAGLAHPEQRARRVMALETAIAATQATRETSANDHNADNGWTRADFTRRAPGLDWSTFFAAAGLGRQETIVAWQPEAVIGAAALVASQPLETWKDYLRVRALDHYADVLPRAIAQPAQALHGEGASIKPRDQRALEVTQRALSDAIGKMYTERYFPAGQKARVAAIVANVRAAFIRRVEAVQWMLPVTRNLALDKLKTLYFGIGYPEQWPDFSDLTVDPADPVGNLRRVEDRKLRQALARLDQPVDRTEWWIAPQTVGAVLLFQQNAYNFPAALLQAPKYDPDGSDAANYGAIGAIVGHEISHFVDRLGAEYQADGAMHHWWLPEDSSRFQQAVEPLVNQFSAYRPFPDLSVNGRVTQTENIADLAGLSAALDAYRGILGEGAKDKDYLRQQDRQFFIGFARSWRSRIGEEALRTQVASNDHAPETYRISTVRNLDAWYDAFDVQPGQRLYLPPGQRVRIW